MRLLTIGGYGFTEATYVDALREAGVDCLLDVRQRRGMRGATYAFLNKSRMELALRVAGIRCVHEPRLAPTTAIRAAQMAADQRAGAQKRNRKALSPQFVADYRDQVLKPYSRADFELVVGANTEAVAFFCVEREPSACHRSLAAAHVGELIGAPVQHLLST